MVNYGEENNAFPLILLCAYKGGCFQIFQTNKTINSEAVYLRYQPSPLYVPIVCKVCNNTLNVRNYTVCLWRQWKYNNLQTIATKFSQYSIYRKWIHWCIEGKICDLSRHYCMKETESAYLKLAKENLDSQSSIILIGYAEVLSFCCSWFVHAQKLNHSSPICFISKKK